MEVQGDWIIFDDGSKAHACGLGERLAAMTPEELAEHLKAWAVLMKAIDDHWDEL